MSTLSGRFRPVTVLSRCNLPCRSEYVQAAVLVFVGADDEAFGRIGRIDPYCRIVGIMRDGVGDENRLDDPLTVSALAE